MTISLKRFTVDYNTWQRVKLNDRVSFAQTINLNDYLHGYDNIKNKKYQQEVEKMQKYNADQIQKNINLELKKQEKLQNLADKKN